MLTRVGEVAAETLPADVSGQFQGATKAFEGALTNLAILLVIAILVVYIVLGVLYESYIHPLTILSGLPSAACAPTTRSIKAAWSASGRS